MTVPKDVRRNRDHMVFYMKRSIGQLLYRHTVILARSPLEEETLPGLNLKYLVGSGTLVQVDTDTARPRYGVLTCGHVLGALDNVMNGAHNDSLTLMAMNNKPKGTDKPCAIEIGYCKDL